MHNKNVLLSILFSLQNYEYFRCMMANPSCINCHEEFGRSDRKQHVSTTFISVNYRNMRPKDVLRQYFLFQEFDGNICDRCHSIQYRIANADKAMSKARTCLEEAAGEFIKRTNGDSVLCDAVSTFSSFSFPENLSLRFLH